MQTISTTGHCGGYGVASPNDLNKAIADGRLDKAIPMERVLGMLKAELERTREEVVRLNSRLGPVLGPSAPTPVDPQKRDYFGESAIVMDIENAIAIVRNIYDCANDANARLEI